MSAERPRAARVEPAETAAEVLTRLRLLKAKRGGYAPAAVKSALRISDSAMIPTLQRDELAVALDVYDPGWVARFSFAVGTNAKGTGARRLLAETFVDVAKRRLEFPALQGDDMLDAQNVLEWASGQGRLAGLGRTSTVAQPALALWPSRDRSFFADAFLLLLGGWTRASGESWSAERFLTAAATIVRSGKAGRTRAASALALCQVASRARKRAETDRAAAVQALDRTRERAVAAEATASVTEAERDSLAARLAESEEARAKEVADHNNAVREQRVGIENTVGVLRSRVLRVVSHEAEQLRLYLDRPDPNAEAALMRVKLLEELASDLKKQE